MGLSSNQARFLSITARQCDLEHRMQNICHRRLRLSQDLQSAARSYDAQTSDRKLYLNTLNTDSLQTTGDYQLIDDGNATNSVGRLNTQGYQVLDTQDNQVIGAFASGSYKVVNSAADLVLALQQKPDMNIVLGGSFTFDQATISDFKGTIYGNGNTITTDHAIFGNINSGAAVYDIKLATSGNIGTDAGFLANTNSGNIDNVYVSGSATAGNNSGLVTGTNNGNISNVTSVASSFSGGTSIGSVAGINNGYISNAVVTGSTSGTSTIGGIAGTNGTSGTIDKASVFGTVNGSNSGGIVGSNSGNVITTFSSNTIGTAGNVTVGGLVGTNNATGTIADSYSVSSIAGASNLGALAGINNGAIGASNVAVLSESGAATAAIGNGTSAAQIIDILTDSKIDSIIEPSLTNSWNKTGAIPVINGVPTTITTSTTPKTRTESVVQQSLSNMTVLSSDAGLNATDKAMYNQLSTTYGGAIDNTNLQIVSYKAAIPDVANPGQYIYQDIVSLAIKTETGLQAVDTACNNAGTKAGALSSNYILTNDITLSGTNNWTAIGNSSDAFTGKFDGNMHEISDMNISLTGNASYQGMFGNIGAGGSVMRTNLDNLSITTTGNLDYAGSIAGTNNGTLENCNSTNMTISVGGTGASNLGGIAGKSGSSNADASINKCSVSGAMNLNNSSCYQVGGFAGWLAGGSITLSSADVDINNTNAIPYATAGSSAASNYMSVFVSDLNTTATKPIQFCYATGDLNTNSNNLGGNASPVAPATYNHSGILPPGSVITGDTDQHINPGDSDTQSDVAYSSYIKNSSTGSDYAIYSGTQKPTTQTDLSSILSDTMTVDGQPVNVWNADGTLNNAASNTVIVNYDQRNITGVSPAPTYTAAHTKNPADYATQLYSDGTASAKTLDANVSLEEGLRSGRYKLLVQADQLTSSVVTPTNANGKNYESVDWRTEPIINDDLYTANDTEAQTIYDRTIRDVNEQDKLLQMEQEKVTTEYQALTSEKDAVKKILGTNAQTSFKYFS